MKQLGDNGVWANRRGRPTTIALRIGALALTIAFVGCGSDSTLTKDAGNNDFAGSGGRDTVDAGGAVGSGGAAGGAIGSGGEAAAGGERGRSAQPGPGAAAQPGTGGAAAPVDAVARQALRQAALEARPVVAAVGRVARIGRSTGGWSRGSSGRTRRGASLSLQLQRSAVFCRGLDFGSVEAWLRVEIRPEHHPASGAGCDRQQLRQRHHDPYESSPGWRRWRQREGARRLSLRRQRHHEHRRQPVRSQR